jgi:hypothetical protein
MNDHPDDKGTGLLQRLRARGIKQPPLDWTRVDRMIAEARLPREAYPDDDTAPPKATRKRKPTVASVIQQMKRAGVEIAGCEINPRDGTVKVITGKPVGGEIDTDDTASPDPRWN